MKKFTEKQLLTSCICVGVIGIIILFIISFISDNNFGQETESPLTGVCGDYVNFAGSVNSVRVLGNYTRFEVSSEVSVIVFEELSIEAGDFIRVNGLIQAGHTTKEVLADKVMKIEFTD